MAFRVYILQSETCGRYYCGQTQELSARVSQHNCPSNDLSKTTKRFKGPWVLIWSVQVGSASEATRLERKIKKRGIGRYLSGRCRGC